MLADVKLGNKTPIGIKPDGTPYNVLIVDDSLFIVKQLTQILASENFRIVDHATDGEMAVLKYRQMAGRIDLVTMDITMPKKDGITALKEIVNFDKDAKVVMISAIGKQDYVKEALLSGAKNYIVKPFNREKVLERLKKVLM